MRVRRLLAAIARAMALPAGAAAQDFGVMESAETINQGNFKLTVNPMFVFHDSDNDAGVALKFGYGFTPRFDMEAKAAIYDGTTFFGADVEYWLVRNRPWDVSAGAGFHVGRGDFRADSTAVDFTLLASRRVAPKLDFFAALDIAVERFDLGGADDSVTTVHIVPGVEYALSADLDLVAELGLSVSDEGAHYLSGGVAYYLR